MHFRDESSTGASVLADEVMGHLIDSCIELLESKVSSVSSRSATT